jgi:hypothetical protein
MLNELAQIQNKDAQPAQQHQVTLNILGLVNQWPLSLWLIVACCWSQL